MSVEVDPPLNLIMLNIHTKLLRIEHAIISTQRSQEKATEQLREAIATAREEQQDWTVIQRLLEKIEENTTITREKTTQPAPPPAHISTAQDQTTTSSIATTPPTNGQKDTNSTSKKTQKEEGK